MFRGLVLFQ